MLTFLSMALISRITSNRIVKLLESLQFMTYMLLPIILEALMEVTIQLLARIQMAIGIITMMAQLVQPTQRLFNHVQHIYCSTEDEMTLASPIKHQQLPPRKYPNQRLPTPKDHYKVRKVTINLSTRARKKSQRLLQLQMDIWKMKNQLTYMSWIDQFINTQ